MPPRALSRNERLTSSGDIGHGLEYRRTSRQHQTSRFCVDKPLSPRTGQGLKLKDKAVRVENSIRPPHSDLPLEFVKNANNVFVVQTKSSGSREQPQLRKSASEEELIKYMSKVPGYLQRGEKVQDNVLNFGVLDWRRLEKWTYKREKNSVIERITRPTTGSCSSSAVCSSATANAEAFCRSPEQTSISSSNSVNVVDFSPVVKPLSGKVLNRPSLQTSSSNIIDGKQNTCKKDAPRRRDTVKFKSAKSKEKYLSHDNCVLTRNSSSNQSGCDHEILETVSRKTSNFDGDLLKNTENFERLSLETPHQNRSGNQESIVLLLPKDFSGSASSEVRHTASFDGKSVENNWGSFSDIFSVDEIHPDESFSDIPHSCPLNYAVETETELDLKLDTLIKAQGTEIPVHPTDMPLHSTENKMAAATSTSADLSGDSSRHRRFSFGISRMAKSLSFREGSAQPPVSSTCVTAKSGPVKPECSTNSGSRNSNKTNTNDRARASPLRRLLDPFLKYKVANQLSEKSDLRMKLPIPVPVAVNEIYEASTIKALLHLSVKSGLPLFKFVVEINNEIFASTVKSFSTLKDNVSWLYTFYSVHKVKKRSGGWKNQRVKPSGFGYDVVGQMKVSEPHVPSWNKHEPNETRMVKESVLYNVDITKEDAATSEMKTGRELAAIVVNMPDAARKSSSDYNVFNLDECYSGFEHEKLGRVVVILPGADHSLPHEGVPSSLINRWRSGGSCDCGGWDIGCKLQILSDKWQQGKVLQDQCDLYDEREAKQCRPAFSLIPLRDGLFSVEFDAKISSLQAFSISVAVISSQKPAHSADQVESKQEFGRTKASMFFEGPDKHAPHPPLSPVGRV